jgi:peptide/nickel transport system substrate-binding protein
MLQKRHFSLKLSHDKLPVKFLFSLLLAVMLLTACVSPAAQTGQNLTLTPPTPTPEVTGRGRGDLLRIFSPDAPTLLNPHLSGAGPNLEASRITYEPLASFDKSGALIPFLAEEIPSLQNGEVGADGKSVTWKLKHNIKWSDGEPFTADDVLFTYQFASNPDVISKFAANYKAIKNIEIIDDYTIKINFNDVTPGWFVPFVGSPGVILPKHIFEPYNGANAREAPANILPVGTGPYRVVSPGIKPQEVWFLGNQLIKTTKIVYEANPYFREADKPYFKRLELLGGGRSDEAERLVLDEGTVDYAFVRGQLPPETVAKLSASDKVNLYTNIGGIVERILLNRTDPNKEVDGERSSAKTQHPFFSDKRVRQAIAYAIDREAIIKLYGPTGKSTTNNLVAPPQFNSPHVFYTYNLEKARQLLDEAGWKDTNNDGIREKDGVKMKIVYQTFNGSIAQQTQQIVKDSLNEIGIEVELKIVDASIMFGDSVDNPDKDFRFTADLISESIGSLSPDPGPYMQYWTCPQIPQKSNNWSAGLNMERWCNSEYDALYAQATTEINPAKQAELFIKMNDLQIEDVVMIPLGIISYSAAITKKSIQGIDLTPWDMSTWNIKDWSQTSQ